MGGFKSIKENLRFELWWNHLSPPVFSTLYIIILVKETPFTEGLTQIAAFTPILIGSAGLGYVINDMSDYKFDSIVGKRNIAALLSKAQLGGLSTLLALCVLLPWMHFDLNNMVLVLLSLQFAAYLIYSIRPFRLKERGILGTLTDSFYGHLNPILVAIFTLIPISLSPKVILWLAPLLLLGIAKGTRNIILHQLHDRKNDIKTGTATFVLNFGALPSLHLINRFILPLEITLAAILVLKASHYIPNFYLGFILFLLFTLLKFDVPRFVILPRRQFKFKFLYFMNDFYEEWLPALVLIFLSLQSPVFVILLLVHLLIFPNFIKKILPDMREIGKNLKLLRP